MMAVAALPLRGMCFAHLIESDGPGGAERMLASVATELQAAGTRNVVIAPAGGEGWLARELKGTGVRVESFRLTHPLSPALARWLEATLRRHRVDLAHSHEFTMAVYGAWAARRAGVPHLFTMHGGRYYAARLRRRVALRVAAELSGSVVAVSESLGRHLSRDLWMRASRVITIPNGARRAPGAPTSLRDELKLAKADRLAVAVGNLYPVKGHRYLLEALALLTTRFPQLHVAIAGRGEMEGALSRRAEALQTAADMRRRGWGEPYMIDLGLGDNDRALARLEASIDIWGPTSTSLKVDPIFDGVRGDPRFQRLLERMGLAQ